MTLERIYRIIRKLGGFLKFHKIETLDLGGVKEKRIKQLGLILHNI